MLVLAAALAATTTAAALRFLTQHGLGSGSPSVVLVWGVEALAATTAAAALGSGPVDSLVPVYHQSDRGGSAAPIARVVCRRHRGSSVVAIARWTASSTARIARAERRRHRELSLAAIAMWTAESVRCSCVVTHHGLDSLSAVLVLAAVDDLVATTAAGTERGRPAADQPAAAGVGDLAAAASPVVPIATDVSANWPSTSVPLSNRLEDTTATLAAVEALVAGAPSQTEACAIPSPRHSKSHQQRRPIGDWTEGSSDKHRYGRTRSRTSNTFGGAKAIRRTEGRRECAG